MCIYSKRIQGRQLEPRSVLFFCFRGLRYGAPFPLRFQERFIPSIASSERQLKNPGFYLVYHVILQVFWFQNGLQNTKNPKPFKVWDTGTGGGVAGSRTRVRRSPPNGAYSLGKFLSYPGERYCLVPRVRLRDFRPNYVNHAVGLAPVITPYPRIGALRGRCVRPAKREPYFGCSN